MAFKPELEWAGEEVSQEQIQRVCNRYYWAGEYCKGKDVVEIACGTGIGSGYISFLSKSYIAGDVSENVLNKAREYYKNRIEFLVFDAHSLPFSDSSKDIIILFEAIYYLKDVNQFLSECKRVLRKDGKMLIATANKDLYDFHPSKFAVRYYGVLELKHLFESHGYKTQFLGDTPFSSVSLKQKLLRPVKKIVVKLNLLPKSNAGKRILKKIVFGNLVQMPNEIDENTAEKIDPINIPNNLRDTLYKVLFCVVSLQ
jgi:ubiquinone/menaquinone biosynthesis C-methylase UbiE